MEMLLVTHTIIREGDPPRSVYAIPERPRQKIKECGLYESMINSQLGQHHDDSKWMGRYYNSLPAPLGPISAVTHPSGKSWCMYQRTGEIFSPQHNHFMNQHKDKITHGVKAMQNSLRTLSIRATPPARRLRPHEVNVHESRVLVDLVSGGRTFTQGQGELALQVVDFIAYLVDVGGGLDLHRLVLGDSV